MGLPAELKSRLKAIGAFTYEDGIWDWESPVALRATLPDATLTMINESDDELEDVLERLLDACDTVQENSQRIRDDARTVCVQVFHDSYVGQLKEEELAKYRDATGRIDDARVGASIVVTGISLIADEDDVYIDIDCSCDWDPEHGVPLSLHDDEVELRI